MGFYLRFGIGPLRYSAPLTGGRRRRRSQSQSDTGAYVIMAAIFAAPLYALWAIGTFVISHPVLRERVLVSFGILVIVLCLCRRSPRAWRAVRTLGSELATPIITVLILGGIVLAIVQAATTRFLARAVDRS